MSETIQKIIEQARWAPSGDNMQQWRFEIINDRRFIVHGHDTRDHCVYDLQGRASQLAIGALLESIAIASSVFRLRAEFSVLSGYAETLPTIEVNLIEQPDLQPDPLFASLPARSVQRRPFKTLSLTVDQKRALERAVGERYRIHWLEGFSTRWLMAWFLQKNGKLRLTLPEAYPTHSTVIEWDVQFSQDRIPAKAVGLDPLATRMMQWAIASWRRVDFLNRYLFGTWLPRWELDFLPGLCCAAHFLIVAESPLHALDDYLQGGRAIQRFWLTATRLGLQLQPEMTPLIFSSYVRHRVSFSRSPKLLRFAEKLAKEYDSLVGAETVPKTVFMARVGTGSKAVARSLRLPVDVLIDAKKEVTGPAL